MDFHVMRSPGAALGLLAFALLCALLPALGLGALLPMKNAGAGSLITLALVGGMAAPFIFACVVFGTLAVYLAANSLHVEVDKNGARHERRVFGLRTRVASIARHDITRVDLRIASRHQNLFSREPRYTLIARHVTGAERDLVVAEDVRGRELATELTALLYGALDIKLLQKQLLTEHDSC